MIKSFLIINLALNMFLWGKPPGGMFFCNVDKPLDKIKPYTEASILQKKAQPIYFYIYSKKKFETDTLHILFIHLDNKGVWFPKETIERTLEVPVNPEDTAVKGPVVLYKEGQYFVRVFSWQKPKNPICETELLIE